MALSKSKIYLTRWTPLQVVKQGSEMYISKHCNRCPSHQTRHQRSSASTLAAVFAFSSASFHSLLHLLDLILSFSSFDINASARCVQLSLGNILLICSTFLMPSTSFWYVCIAFPNTTRTSSQGSVIPTTCACAQSSLVNIPSTIFNGPRKARHVQKL